MLENSRAVGGSWDFILLAVGMCWRASGRGAMLSNRGLKTNPLAAVENELWKVRWKQGGQSGGCPR